MKTYILPGFSEKNKNWVDETVNELTPLILAKGIYWQHWSSGQVKDGWIEKEAQKIIIDSNNEKINIISKSVGTMVCLEIIKSQPQLVNKIILCGIPLADFLPGDEKRYKELKNFSPNNVLCIQNSKDNHGSYAEAKAFVYKINPNIKIISKSRDDHHYPYPKDFINFLKK